MMTTNKKLVGIVAGAGIGIGLLWWLMKTTQAAPPPEPGAAEVTGFSIVKD
ncbi:MAG: hypothetical protein J7J01_08100 [Methanophagales archaeon]|nr:hypothetical protein [Methanophagales archaeon]